ncbi:MAG TPA: xanthine dehydrogenase family protein subunit M, partial [Thermoanaerobaculia bacterium]|nr:xanthine dehydrogenase family protein subunit M [Thermoanaerobaculia bacterium]
TTLLEPDEILVEVAIPPLPARTGCAFLEIARRHGDYAQVGIAALVTLDDAGRCREARLVYLSAGDRPIVAREAARLLAGQEISPQAITAAADKASRDEMEPFGDVHATAEFKRHLARVLTGRALRKAAERAGRTNGRAA